MAFKKAVLPGIGEVFLYKRRGARNIRLSLSPSGKVRISLPAWAPYSSGLAFAANRRDWLMGQLAANQDELLRAGQQIGKAHRLIYKVSSGKTSTTVTSNEVLVRSPLPLQDHGVQAQARKASERALRAEASSLLPQRLKTLADKNGFSFKEVKIKKLTARWGSCSQDAVVTLSYFLIQLPWPLIDYVIIHELAHTQQHNHQKQFWALVERAISDTKQKRKEIRQYQPRLLSA